MDNSHTPPPPAHLLNDLESIRELLEDGLEPPLLTDTFDPDAIPLLSEVVAPPPSDARPLHAPEPLRSPQAHAAPEAPTPEAPLRNTDPASLDSELRAAAQLILQDVIDDFVPQIEAELKRRLEARLSRLLPPRRG
ncbi:DNA polymerase III subunit chi [Pseudomonas mangiferae]|uniref:DNA polymerase III subunit chi n=1 Tax=Pseudomonas mangiferae TaxID=2593654 RepID=A0A553H3L6_9PSED|nr:DNA polymerase III subunit chi [Pseudomonas mangiferae]TRX76340.1 DNA polymerase III subunit chi [Pseudomonas mangiferae]